MTVASSDRLLQCSVSRWRRPIFPRPQTLFDRISLSISNDHSRAHAHEGYRHQMSNDFRIGLMSIRGSNNIWAHDCMHQCHTSTGQITIGSFSGKPTDEYRTCSKLDLGTNVGLDRDTDDHRKIKNNSTLAIRCIDWLTFTRCTLAATACHCIVLLNWGTVLSVNLESRTNML